MSHFIKQCECGMIIAQCRCPGPKPVEIVRPCSHGRVAPTASNGFKKNMIALLGEFQAYWAKHGPTIKGSDGEEYLVKASVYDLQQWLLEEDKLHE